MIYARFREHGDTLTGLTVKGHSGSAAHGEDLVCAAVSGIMFGLCNACDQLGSYDIEVADNLIRIENLGKDDTVLRVGLLQLQTVEETNRRYVKVEISEV